MRLAVTGKIKKKEADEIKKAVKFFASILMKPRLLDLLSVTVRFVEEQPHKAECEWMGTDPVRPKNYRIQVKTGGSKKGLLMNLAHEMTHVKQFATGELRDLPSKPKEVLWKNKRHIFSEKSELYWMSPWEIDAYGREYGCWKLWTEHKNREKRLYRKKK